MFEVITDTVGLMSTLVITVSEALFFAPISVFHSFSASHGFINKYFICFNFLAFLSISILSGLWILVILIDV